MATVSPSPDQAADLLQNLTLESQGKALEIPEPAKKASAIDLGSLANGHTQPADRSVTPLLPDYFDPTLCYFNGYPSSACFYGSYDPSGNHWADYSRYANSDGSEMRTGVYGDNLYHGGYGYPPYNPYSPATTPVATSGNEGQLYGQQQYQYPPYFKPPTQSSAQPASAKGELSSTAATDEKPLPVEAVKGSPAGFVNEGLVKARGSSTPYKPTYQNWPRNFANTYGMGSLPGYYDPKFNLKGQYGSLSKLKNDPSLKNNSVRRNSSYMGYQYPGPVSGYGSTHGFMNRMYPSKVYAPYGYGMGYEACGYDSRSNALGWFSTDHSKYKPRGRGNGYPGCHDGSIDGLDERNRGPRADGSKNEKDLAPATLAEKGQLVPPIDTIEDDQDEKFITPDSDRYNLDDFPEDYIDARFFVIKSYSEDDVHKSIKYNVWSSTSNGNKKLNAAYDEAQKIGGPCPIFLLFSVNTSGQFVGLAEMVGHVDFDKNVDYWQQDKWTGCFPVKWHIVKDVPNNLLKHITLENNENKPVTNSRDTQEVMMEQGLKILKIFKNHTSKTCILDDFAFYEEREKIIQEKKAKKQCFQKHVSAEKAINEKAAAAAIASSKSLEVPSDPKEDPISTPQSNANLKPMENGSVSAASGNAEEDRSLPNGTANGC